jgi:4-hydroxybenzoate polyprenyltransferase
MPVERILIVVGLLAVMGLFAFQLWSVLRTGHVRWRVQMIHRDRRPVAFWFEVAANVVGFLLFGGLLVAQLIR